jgi:hypothetical protein
VLFRAKFINRAVFPDGRRLQPGEQVDWDQNNNRWSADNEFLDTHLLPGLFLPLAALRSICHSQHDGFPERQMRSGR